MESNMLPCSGKHKGEQQAISKELGVYYCLTCRWAWQESKQDPDNKGKEKA